jgi:hypothetical protein
MDNISSFGVTGPFRTGYTLYVAQMIKLRRLRFVLMFRTPLYGEPVLRFVSALWMRTFMQQN